MVIIGTNGFGNMIFTEKGLNLLAKAETGTQLSFTRVAVGDGYLSGQDVTKFTTLIEQIMSLDISSIVVSGASSATVCATLSNVALVTGFYWREIGIFATDPQLGEILFGYDNSTGHEIYVPPASTSSFTAPLNVGVYISNAANVTAVIDPSLVYATSAQVNTAMANAETYTDTKVAAVTVVSIGAETPTGAQTKASAALVAAESYTDGTVAVNTTAIATNATAIAGTNTNLATHLASTVHKQVSGVTQSGSYSSAEGGGTTASGIYSHAEGVSTVASGATSHAEGSSTTASGINSHAEGYVATAKTDYAHAEGQYSLACNGTLYNITAFDNTAKTITLDNVTGLIVGDLLTVKITSVKATEDIPITVISGLVVTLNTTATITASWKQVIKKLTTMYPVHAEGTNTIASGNQSHAEGYLAIASGANSHAEGSSATAIGNNSHAEGSSVARGMTSHAEGVGTNASGDYSHAEGQNTTASGTQSHAEGSGTIASGMYSHAEGNTTTASGSYSHAEGNSTTANGNYAHAEGASTTASGTLSHAQNNGTTSRGMSQTTIGEYNVPQGTTASKVTTDAAFIIGNGASGASANAFRVTWAGAAYGLSAYNSTGADYSEFFEWLDENLNSEDRVGYFVTLDGEKIRKAISTDNYILGIVSATPAIVGDSFNDDWQGRYVVDAWGRRLTCQVVVSAVYETRIVPAVLDAEGNIITEETTEQVEITPEHTDTVFVQNPDWNPDTPYIPRENRKEWSTIGMLGKLFVRDDGTCVVNGYCKSNDNGIATVSVSGYRVIKRVADTIVQVLLK